MSYFQVKCPKCGSDQCHPTYFRNDAQCIPCGAEFDMYGESWWSSLLRRLFYR